MRFQDRVVIVTGGGKGIGAGCVEVFSEEGARVAVIDHDTQAGTAVVAQCNARRADSARSLSGDVSDTDWLQQTIEEIAAHFGRIDCLINNVGIHPPDTPIERTTIPQLRQVLEINFVSCYAASLFALPHLRKTRGTIINMSSMTAVLGQKNSAAYAASKGAQVSFTKSLALEVAADGVRVNAVLPSNVDTPLMHQWAATLPDPEAALARIAALQPLGRMAAPQEIGRVCLFLATDDSSFITGQAIEVDGGASLDY